MKCLVVVLTLYNSIQFYSRWPTWGIYRGLFYLFVTEEFHPSSTRNFSHCTGLSWAFDKNLEQKSNFCQLPRTTENRFDSIHSGIRLFSAVVNHKQTWISHRFITNIQISEPKIIIYCLVQVLQGAQWLSWLVCRRQVLIIRFGL